MPNHFYLTITLLASLGSIQGFAQDKADSIDVQSSNHTLKRASFNQGIQVNPLGLIQGRVPGLWVIGSGSEPNRRYDLYLRGLGSFEGARQPLYVVDGVPQADPGLVSPADVAEIRVLTDPVSMAQYGARSANGVIEITTKTSHSDKFSFRYEAQGGIQFQTRSVTMLSADEFRARLTPNFQRFDQGGNSDWPKAIRQTAFQQNHYLGASGMYRKLRVSCSLNLISAPGIIRHNALNRLNGRLTVSSQNQGPFYWEISALGRQEKQLPLDGVALTLSMSGLPTIPIYQPDGSYTPYSSFDGGNPVARLAQVKQSETMGQGQFQGFARYRLTHQLTLDGQLAHTSSSARFAYNDRDYTSQGAQDFRLTERINSNYARLNVRYRNSGSKTETQALIGLAIQQSATTINNDMAGQSPRGARTSWSLMSLLAQGEWGGFNRHLWLRAAVRLDGSSRFGNTQWMASPGVTAEWRIAASPKLRTDDTPTQTKAISQNDLSLFAGAHFTANQLSLLEPTTPATVPNLEPEMQRLLNAGFRASLLAGWIQGQFAVFNRFTDKAYWFETGAINPSITNRGQIRNLGTEWQLSVKLAQSKQVQWELGWVGSFLYNRILSMGTNNYRVVNGAIAGRGLTGQNSYVVEAGVPLYTFYGYSFAGINSQGKYAIIDQNRDGRITADADRIRIASALPRWQIGLRSTLSVGHWQLSGLVDGLLGHSLLNATQLNVANLLRYPINNISREALQTGLNDYTTFTSQYIQPGRFLRLNYLTLAYRLPGFFKHQLTITGTLQNFLLSTSYGGPDPEAALGATPFGHDNQVLAPNAATASLGVRFGW